MQVIPGPFPVVLCGNWASRELSKNVDTLTTTIVVVKFSSSDLGASCFLPTCLKLQQCNFL